MKVRCGFVSNSSSSSFLIYGWMLKNREDGEEYYVKIREMNDMRVHVVYGQEDCYIGCSWDSIHDNETGLEFKTKIENEIKELTGEDKIECSTYEEGWYDG